MRKQLFFLFFLCTSLSWGQISFLTPYELELQSTLAYENLEEEAKQLQFSLEAQQWPVQVLRYVLMRLQQNPFVTEEFYVNVRIFHPDRSRVIHIQVPVNKRYIEAFKTEEGFNSNYYDFLQDTYDWMMSRL